jgi:hypothetical protein
MDNSMCRFKPGDQITVISSTNSMFSGVNGVVDEVTPHPKNLTQLDSYIVRFAWGERKKFWDAELELAGTKTTNG